MKETKDSGQYNIGANPSQEEQQEEMEAAVSKGIDICKNHNLEEGTHDFTDKKHFMKYMKKWAKRVAGAVKAESKEEEASDNVDKFQKAALKFFEEMKTNYDNYQFFRADLADSGAEEFDDLYYIPAIYNEAKGNYTFYYFKQALKEVKF